MAGSLALLLALYCLAMTAVTLGAAAHGALAPARVPILIPVIWLVFLIVLGAVARRPRRRSESTPEASRPTRLP